MFMCALKLLLEWAGKTFNLQWPCKKSYIHFNLCIVSGGGGGGVFGIRKLLTPWKNHLLAHENHIRTSLFLLGCFTKNRRRYNHENIPLDYVYLF